MRGVPPLTTYRRLWWTTVLAICLPALALGLARAPIPLLVLAVTAVGLYVGVALPGADPSRRPWVEAGGGMALVLAGAPTLGGRTVPLLLLTAVTSVPVVQRILPGAFTDNRVRSMRSPGVTDSDAEPCWATMTGSELCRLWTLSYRLVKTTSDPAQRAVGAGLRCAVLDELERRDSTLFSAWLARNPCPASAPTWAASAPPRPPAPHG